MGPPFPANMGDLDVSDKAEPLCLERDFFGEK